MVVEVEEEEEKKEEGEEKKKKKKKKIGKENFTKPRWKSISTKALWLCPAACSESQIALELRSPARTVGYSANRLRYSSTARITAST